MMGIELASHVIRKTKYFSVIADCTPDTSHVEQLSLTIRFADLTNDDEIEICERLLGFTTISNSTGMGLEHYKCKRTCLHENEKSEVCETQVLRERFEQLGQHAASWGFPYNIQKLPQRKELEYYSDLQLALTLGTEADIENSALCNELVFVETMNDPSPLKILDFIKQTHLEELSPNIWISLRILFTISVPWLLAREASQSCN
ncbi:hypothetical protein ILUMI_16759 [Ignelater luminosus]|uniref:DUF4371 domain-containing protein n=1 Tax=Ignelater luminosus TaxID=2038154 RepID=A0A8K0CMZ1_IGNLU|nr:hypothetical protein ILUMI_16759 [Ignelater luminosus]